MPRRQKKSRLAQYQQRWYRVGDVGALREHYKHSRKAFLADFRNDDASLLGLIEDGMALFSQWEESGLKRLRTRSRPINVAGRAILSDLLTEFATGTMSSIGSNDFVLASIDLEGMPEGRGGISGYGFATVDTRSLLQPTLTRERTTHIDAMNYRTNGGNRGFVFGDTERIEPEDLREVIINSLSIPEEQPNTQDNGACEPPVSPATFDWDRSLSTPPPLTFDPESPSSDSDSDLGPSHDYITPRDQALRKIVIVGYGLGADMYSLKHLGIDLERDLPMVTGVFDVAILAREVTTRSTNSSLKLHDCLEELQIPHREEHLHNAGNDAVFTMQALMGLLSKRVRSLAPGRSTANLDSLAYRPCPPAEVREEKNLGDWESYLKDFAEVSEHEFS